MCVLAQEDLFPTAESLRVCPPALTCIMPHAPGPALRTHAQCSLRLILEPSVECRACRMPLKPGLVAHNITDLLCLAQDARADAVKVDALSYDADMTVTDSDHKPVWSVLSVVLPVVIHQKRRRKCAELLQECFHNSLPEPPQVTLSTETLIIPKVTPSYPPGFPIP